MSQSRLQGVIAASITPVTPDHQIDVPRLAAHIGQLLAKGCSHVSTFGTTGEGASFATGQKVAALQALKAMGVDMGRQVPAIMTPVLDDAVRSLVAYRELGCRAVLVLPPFYYGATEAGIAGFYDALIERTSGASDIDLLLYNIPQLSRVKFTKSLVETILSRHGSRIVGIKDSTGDIENGLMLVESFRNLAIFTGDDRVLPTLVSKGGAGMIGGMPNVFASDLKALYDNPGNREILDKQAKRIVAVDNHGSLVALKAALAHYGGDEDLARALPPLQALDAKQRASLIALFEDTGFRAAA
ncbi:dihydrodipicolinate synthase family protein [Rhizobium sp. RU36D]|uniref:dihydrodipicolinate synthase family protein n=1 Tax=Rhizobium sp. RU36D TaxID=1907415 RepID=UPI0009D90A03|nr:dihydrodipicolinate synthase family protein [Rhizobium sp. RU36D]SMC99992.1 4-hydroxy-tetrahydrodipicolinate synthase [Rhizobium sp. RU36D]